MGGFIGALAHAAQGAVDFAPYALKAVRENEDRSLAEATRKAATDRQAKLDALNAALTQSTIAKNNATTEGMGDEAVTYAVDGEGNRVALPKKVPRGTFTGPQAPAPAAPSPVPDFKGPTDADWRQSVRGTGPQAPQQQSAPPQQQAPVQPRKPFIGVQTGTTGPAKAPPAAPKIDPRSVAGISADSTRAVNAQAAKVNNPLPAKPSTASTKPGPYSQEAITADSIKAANRAALKPGGMTGGMGSGGIGGLARTSAAITELGQAHDMMTPYEEQVRHKTANYDGLDYFTGLRGKMYDAHGIVDQATHAAAFSHLNQVNPDLANYLRAAEMWGLADGGVSGKTSDFRTKMDAFVSAIGPNAGASQIDNVQRTRATRLDELHQFQPAMRAAAQRFVQPGAPKAGAAGNIDLRAPAPASPLRQKYDAAVAHLKAQGKSDAEIQKMLPPPGDD